MIEVLKQMTEALEDITRLLQGITGGTFSKLDDAIQAGSQAIAELESQEPVAYLVLFEGAGQLLEFKKGNYIHGAKVKHIPLYTKTKIEMGCSECGIGGGHALYCVRCAEKFVGGYKENVPVHTSELLTQVSTDTQYAGNGTAVIQNETKPAGFFFQMPPQRTWVGLDHHDKKKFSSWLDHKSDDEVFTAIEAKLKELNT
jgi:hypothetical protein